MSNDRVAELDMLHSASLLSRSNEFFARSVSRIVALALLIVLAGVTSYELAKSRSWVWLLLVPVLIGLGGLYWVYVRLLTEQRVLTALSEISVLLVRSGQSVISADISVDESLVGLNKAELNAILELIRVQLGARRIALDLWSNSPQSHTFVAGDQLFVSRTQYGVSTIPLYRGDQRIGVLEVHGWHGFNTARARLLDAVASQLATVIDNWRLMAQLRYESCHDSLTGLLNLQGFSEAAQATLDQDAACPAILRIDIQPLAAISDALGYAWNDRLLVVAAERLRATCGLGVPIARLEGGSFAALIADSATQIEAITDQVRAELSVSYSMARFTMEASVTIGYVIAEPAESNVDELLRHAEMAASAARGTGSLVRRYVPSMGQTLLRRFELVTQFRQALADGQVLVHYQPKIALPSRQVLGVEALVRWKHPVYGMLNPDEFVSAVEAGGLADALTLFVTEQALRKIREWLDRGVWMGVSVNLSACNLADENFPDQIAAALTRNAVPPELVTFELTESSVISDSTRSLPVLRRLHALGILLAIDDFGTGYSSLSYLRQLPVDEIKIDKSFVFGMGNHLGDLALVRTIVELGCSLELTVVAEGVEDAAVQDQLASLGCHVAQGYLISPPLPAEKLETWLSSHTVATVDTPEQTVLTLV